MKHISNAYTISVFQEDGGPTLAAVKTDRVDALIQRNTAATSNAAAATSEAMINFLMLIYLGV